MNQMFRTYSATLQMNQGLEIYLTFYWDRKVHPEAPVEGSPLVKVLGRQVMLQRVNEALDRWKQVAQLGGARFTLESMLERLIDDEDLGAARIVVQDSNGQGAETFHAKRYRAFLGLDVAVPHGAGAGAMRKAVDESGPDYGTPDAPA